MTASDARRRILQSLSLLVACSALACQQKPPRATVSGEVTYQGESVPYGDIVFQPLQGWDGFYCQGKILDGKYEIPSQRGPIVGENRVEIHGFRMTDEVAPDISGQKLDEEPAMMSGLIPYIPVEYNTSSDMTVQISAGENTQVDFHLK